MLKLDVLNRLVTFIVEDIINTRPPRVTVKNPRGYPETVAEVIDDKIKYRKTVLDAMKKFRKSNPWKGGGKTQELKIRRLNRDLAKAYEIERPTLVFLNEFAYGACYWPVGNLIIMQKENDGRYSIVTYLHEFGHALGKNEQETCRWSVNLFRKFFPNSFKRLVPDGHLLRRQDSIEKEGKFIDQQDKAAS